MNMLSVIVDDAPHPILTGDASWVGVMVILVVGLIFAATAVGIVVRMNREDRP